MTTISEIIPSHDLALLIQKGIGAAFRFCHISPSEAVKEYAYAVIVLLIALAIGWVLRKWVLVLSCRSLKVHSTPLTQEMIKEKVLMHCSHIIPPLVMLALLPFAFSRTATFVHIAEKVICVYTAAVVAIAINSILTLIWARYDERENTKNLPLKGVLNSAKGVVWIITVITAVSIIIERSPGYLLTGLGAFAAALMLIFKDSILGFVASLQLSQNDMLRVGDWIAVPNTQANGVVLDMSLTAVKVQNWDNTIVTMPPYTLVSTSFRNWRGMYDANARQIDRSLFIDSESVRPLNAGEAADIAAKLPLLSKFVSTAKEAETPHSGTAVVNGTIDTNLGLMRAYLCEYILQSPYYDFSQQLLVRVNAPTPYGIPLNIYCYTATTEWTSYEAIQSALFEHILAVAPIFGVHILKTPVAAPQQ